MMLNDFFVVGIGASAGGHAALKEFFENLSRDTNAAFIIVTHLARDRVSQLPTILSKFAPMPVVRLSGKDSLQSRHIYVLPENAMATVEQGVVHLQARSSTERVNHAVDVFLRSLAKDAGNRAIGVIFSGGGNDGAQGVKCIHDQGGKVLVQAPASASFSWMPTSAIESDSPDLILSPAKLAQAFPDVMYATE
ncbi:chemotaxis protein CheB [Pseudochryseolinea flava]|uniref:protein-glutamate methylesterase n=1 Tax=Pseudochryseolinea flava TaxID=2059302 RepID=A0A364XXJ8_9BACT|nr:chemotaxis protein CheB [Pseudochryseolinea flava]RAV98136.1 hypothetical protein DQQ10_25040 [Pseudochryseolinea flava]